MPGPPKIVSCGIPQLLGGVVYVWLQEEQTEFERVQKLASDANCAESKLVRSISVEPS